MLELDELKRKWSEQDEEIDRLTRETDLRFRLRWKGAGLYGEAFVWLLIAVALGGYVADHLHSIKQLLCGGAVALYALGMLGLTIRQLAAAKKIDYSEPIVELQKSLKELRIARLRSLRWGILAGTVIWAPCSVILGFDAANAAWLWTNVALGVALIPVYVWLSRRFSRSIADAEAYLAGLADFRLDRER